MSDKQIYKEYSKIPNDELIDIFNNILDTYVYLPALSPFNDPGPSWQLREYFPDFCNHVNKKKENKNGTEIENIEFNLSVFESIPRNKIYEVMQEFIGVLADFYMHKLLDKKKMDNSSYRQRKKDIKIIKNYQSLIYDYVIPHQNYAVTHPALDAIYKLNESLLEELKNRKYHILNEGLYEKVRYFKRTKGNLKSFFEDLEEKYSTIKATDIKNMIDIIC